MKMIKWSTLLFSRENKDSIGNKQSPRNNLIHSSNQEIQKYSSTSTKDPKPLPRKTDGGNKWWVECPEWVRMPGSKPLLPSYHWSGQWPPAACSQWFPHRYVHIYNLRVPGSLLAGPASWSSKEEQNWIMGLIRQQSSCTSLSCPLLPGSYLGEDKDTVPTLLEVLEHLLKQQ